ncbi:DUF1697 domain-containing protein [Candidatus Saccharibacteria bacterium]|nr:DUF1697 domain-containing protein [Candidatus Saccharibacteria bacterium]MCB9835061.1 DUF1697 domain-containing protein [Candidatus Nomurabacteria bacterium]
MKFVALLRGINVGGKNKIPMSELKRLFEDLGFDNVLTYINSGNVIFETEPTETPILNQACEQAIAKHFGFHIVCSVIEANRLIKALDNSPSWWDQDEGKHNAIFVIAPKTTAQVIDEIGDTKPEYEKISAFEPIIFWSAPIETFSKTRYSQIVGSKAYQFITIRNANTTKKLAQLCRLET